MFSFYFLFSTAHADRLGVQVAMCVCVCVLYYVSHKIFSNKKFYGSSTVS